MKKKIKKIVETSMLGAAGGMALGGMGDVHGQQGIAKATSFMPMMGTMAGAGMLMESIPKMTKKKKKKGYY